MKRICGGLCRLAVALTLVLPVFAARGPEDYKRIASDVVKLREISRVAERDRRDGVDRLRVTLVGEVVEVDRTGHYLGTEVRTLVIDYTVDLAARAAAEKKFRTGGAKTKSDADFVHEPDPPKLDAKKEFWAHLAPAGGRLGNVNRYAGRIVNMQIDSFAGPVFVPVAGQYTWDAPQGRTRAAAVTVAPAETFTGTVRTGLMAIGGETTGIVLTTRAGEYELDVRGDREAAAKLEVLNGKEIIVTGDYRPRRGVEVKERRIIIVRGFRAAP
jgi:hypothetical protein